MSSITQNPPITMVGIGEIAIVKEEGGVLKTMALGSCVGVMIYEKTTGTIGMAHIALPESQISPAAALTRPGRFADTAIPELIKKLSQATGVKITPRNSVVKIAGGANICDGASTFNIGKRNVMAVRKFLWKFRLGPSREDIGGSLSRTVTMDRNTGRIVISNPTKGTWEL